MGIRREIQALALLAIAQLWDVPGCHSQQATPLNSFRPATPEQLENIKHVARLKPMSTDPHTQALVNELGSAVPAKIIAVRFENSNCVEECATAFFLEQISDANFAGAAFLPPSTTLSDVSHMLCDSCGPVWPIIFQNKDGKQSAAVLVGRAILVSKSQ